MTKGVASFNKPPPDNPVNIVTPRRSLQTRRFHRRQSHLPHRDAGRGSAGSAAIARNRPETRSQPLHCNHPGEPTFNVVSERIVTTLLNQAPIVEYEHLVYIANGGEAMSNHDDGHFAA